MVARALGAVVVLAVAGAAGGYAVSGFDTEAPATISVAAPVPAADPSYPVVEYDAEPDPTTPALNGYLPLRTVRMIEGDARLSADVPVGWEVVDVDDKPTWNASLRTNPSNTYILRVTVPGQTVPSVVRDDRMNQLRSAEQNDDLQHVVFETVDADGFVATYVADGYLRVATERFVSVGGSVVDVSVVGREVDRDGMSVLQQRVVASLSAL